MTDKTEEQIAKEKEAVDAMRNAKSNMTVALDRVATLENALRAAKAHITILKDHVGSRSIMASGDNRRYVPDVMADEIAAIDRVLG